MVTDFLVIGGGVVGINIARELNKRYSDAKVTLIEKEGSSTCHSSGRNSGVLHAGFYYTADSLKARFTAEGNRLLTEYCDERKLPINKCGKLVVAQNEKELESLDLLYKRGQKNGVVLQEITDAEAREIEPRVLTYKKALFSPATSSVSPVLVVESMLKQAIDEGVVVEFNTKYIGKKGDKLITSKKTYSPGYVVNAAGLYADYVARDFGYSENYRILPFKGLYLYSNEPEGAIRTNIYPVPNLQNPFLGVHYTITVDGHIKIGPTAIPAFWREQYEKIDNFSMKEFVEIILRELSLFASSEFNFSTLAVEELRKYSRKHLASLASQLVTGVKTRDYRKWGRPGIRAQLIDIKKRKLEMDFVLEGDDKSMHVLNAVSPGFTCCIPFSNYVCDQISEKIA